MTPARAPHVHAPLVRVLDHRREQAEAQRRVVGQLQREQAEAEAALQVLLDRAEAERGTLATASGPLDLQARLSTQGYLDRLDAAAIFQREVVAGLHLRIESERAVLLERRRDTQLLERLLERRQAEAALETARAEARSADELATSRYTRRLQGGA